MFNNKLPGGKSGGLLLAGLAAFAYYKYSKMSEAEKSNLAQTIRQKGEELLNQFIPGGLGNKANTNTASSNGDAAYTGEPATHGGTY